MHHYFIENGKRYLYDTVCGGICEITRLQKELIPYLNALEQPLPDVCPTALRYSLAKYEVSAINEAYSSLLSLIRSGLISADGNKDANSDTVKIRFDAKTLPLALRAVSITVNNQPTAEIFAVICGDDCKEEFARSVKNSFTFLKITQG